MQKIIKAINEYKPTCEQEEVDKKLFLQVAETIPNSLTRESTLVHFTTSAFVINKQKTKLVSAWHNIYKSWAWLGGHNDGDDDFLRVVLKEIQEESGLKNIKPFTDGIFAIESLCVLPHTRKGAFVPAHIHLNATYVFVANENQNLRIQPDENSKIAWLTFEDFVQKVTEPHMLSVYGKIINKIKLC